MRIKPLFTLTEYICMRNALLTTFSLMLFAVVVSQSSTAFAQRQTCALELKVIEPNKSERDELKPIIGARAIATKFGSRRTIPAVMVEGQPIFPELTDGDYKITITKRGFKRTVQPISFICLAPSQDTLIYFKLERGSSSQTVAYEKLTVTAGIVTIGTKEPGDIAGSSDPGTVVANAVDSVPSTSRPVIRGGVLNGNAFSLPKPEYPAAARSAGVSGTVSVQITIDEVGNVIFATAVSGHPLLQSAAVEAARSARFKPTLLSGQPVRVSGVINYNFVLQ